MPAMSAPQMSWEEAVRWYRGQPGSEAAIRANYFDLPVRAAAERYAASEEFKRVLQLVGRGGGSRLLDLGAGNGIASYALARVGWRVTAVEPDPSEEVGAGAIRALAAETGLPIEVVDRVPDGDDAFDTVFARQVLHHVPDLEQTMRDLFRLLRRDGMMLALREHVVDSPADLARFRAAHPLHAHYGGENAHLLEVYVAAARAAGFKMHRAWGPLESVLNFHPGSEAQRVAHVRSLAARRIRLLGRALIHVPGYLEYALRMITAEDRTPGRIYSFLFRKRR